MPARIRKGDEVQVISGKDKGKRGKVLEVLPKEERVVVEGLNMVKRHTKPRGQVMQGGIIDKEMPIHISNVALWCKDCGATRIGYRFANDGTKKRVCRKCGSDI